MTANGNLPSEPLKSDQGVKPLPVAQAPVKGAVLALGVLIGINLFNYIDRQILSANNINIEDDFASAGRPVTQAQIGLLATAFMVAYMVFAPLFGWLADRMGAGT